MSENDEHQFTLRILKPSEMRLFRSAEGDSRTRLTLFEDRSYLDVRVSRAFPFTDPGRYIGLRDMMDADIGLIVDSDELDTESRDVIVNELSRRYFTPRVKKVDTVEEEHGAVTFLVQTDRGERRFVVRNLRDNSYSLGPNRVMMTDSEGNRYEFPDITSYGVKAYEVLAKVL
jgi:hypothetical protein